MEGEVMRIEGGDGLKDLGESCQLTTPSLRKYTLPSLFLEHLETVESLSSSSLQNVAGIPT